MNTPLAFMALSEKLGLMSAVGELSYKLDGRGKLLSLPAKALRKWERMALFGTVRA